MGLEEVSSGGTINNSASSLWFSAKFLSGLAKAFTAKYGHSLASLLSWIPVPEEEERKYKIIFLFMGAGALLIASKVAEKRSLKSKVHLPFAPQRIAMEYVIFNHQKRIPLWKRIYYYITEGYEYHSSVSAEEIRRLKKNTREQYEELVGGKKTLPYADCQRRDTSSMLRQKNDYPNEEIINTQEFPEEPDDDEMLMLAVDNMTRSLGHFSRKIKMQILDKAARIHCPKGYQLFNIGDMDDAMYFVVSGSVEIYFHNKTGRVDAEVKVARKGDHINSFFSFIDAVTGFTKPYKSVEAVCLEDSIIVKIPFQIFKECWLTDSPRIVSAIRSIIMRIFQVNYIVFDQLLGLRSEFTHFVRDPTPNDLVVDWDDEEIHTEADVGSKHRVSQRMTKEALDSFMEIFGLPEDAREILEESHVYSVDVCHGTAPITTDAFYYIHKGVVEIFKRKKSAEGEIEDVYVDISDCHYHDEDNLHEQHSLWLYPGETFGGLRILIGDSGYLWRRLLCKSVLVRISLETFTKLLNKYPQIIYHISQEFIKRVSKFARQMDFCLEWRRLDSGDTLFTTETDSDDTYVVLNGLLKSQRKEASGKVTDIGTYKRRDWVGLVESLTGVPRTKSVVAHRETELAKLPSSFIKAIKKNFHTVAPVLMNYLAKRVLQKYGTLEMPPTMRKRCSTISIVHVSGFAPTYVFGLDLMKSYCSETGGSAVMVTENDICKKLSIPNFLDINDVFVNEWLATLEDRHDLIIYMVDNVISPWSYKCCSASDIITGVVTSKDLRTELREIEVFYDLWAENAKKELVICHEIIHHPGGTTPFGTKAWLEPRPWLHRHHHIRYPPSAFKFATVKDRAFVNEFYGPLKDMHNRNSDIARITRWYSGQSTGVVFGASSMEGMAVFVGALEAMECFDIPIDMICGAGWASLVAALYSIHQCSKRVERKVHWIYQLLTDKVLLFFDTGFPFYVAQYEGELLNHCYHGALGDIQIEDLIIPYFASTSDISSRIAKMHISGSLWRLARASATRIRVHPPMCDPLDGGYLVDGSYCHPVPTNLMRKFGAAFVITVEIGSPSTYDIMGSAEGGEDKTTPVTYTEIPSLFDIRDVLSGINSVFYQKKQAVKDKFNMTVSVDISTDEDPEDIDHELFAMLLYRGYSHMFYRLKIVLADPIESPEDFWMKLHTPAKPPAKRVDDNSAECHRLLYEEKARYQRNNVQEIIENFESSNLQFLREGQLV